MLNWCQCCVKLFTARIIFVAMPDTDTVDGFHADDSDCACSV